MKKILSLILISLMASFAFTVHAKNMELKTTLRGVLTVAVTDLPNQDIPTMTWTNEFFQAFAMENGLVVRYVTVPFEKAWEQAAKGQVDVVATGVSALPDRQIQGAKWSKPYLEESRCLRIHEKDASRFQTIKDFIGHRVGVLSGTTSEIDLRNRAPTGVDIVLVKQRAELYELFNQGKIDAIAEGTYTAIKKAEPTDTRVIDVHDFITGKKEELVFVVYEGDHDLLDEINAFITTKGFPIK
jgi:ABC-type amino acid transport substrate-binding protein